MEVKVDYRTPLDSYAASGVSPAVNRAVFVMVLQRNESEHQRALADSWQALGEGGPTLVALANLCARNLAQPPADDAAVELSGEAKAILVAARETGCIEVRGVRTAFEAPARYLAVYVELEQHRTVAFRSRDDVELTVRFFDGLVQLCRAGLVMHHLARDFSLTRRGFEVARAIDRQPLETLLGQATEFGLHD